MGEIVDGEMGTFEKRLGYAYFFDEYKLVVEKRNHFEANDGSDTAEGLMFEKEGFCSAEKSH